MSPRYLHADQTKRTTDDGSIWTTSTELPPPPIVPIVVSSLAPIWIHRSQRDDEICVLLSVVSKEFDATGHLSVHGFRPSLGYNNSASLDIVRENVVNCGPLAKDANLHDTYVELSDGKPHLFIFGDRKQDTTERTEWEGLFSLCAVSCDKDWKSTSRTLNNAK